MNSIQTIQLLKEIEEKLGVEDWTLDNICVWPYITDLIYWKLYTDFDTPICVEGNRKDKTLRKIFYPLIAFVNLALRDIFYKTANKLFSNTQAKHPEVIVSGEATDRVFINEISYNRYLDFFSETLEEKGVKFLNLESTFLSKKLPLKKIYPTYFYDLRLYIYVLTRYLFKKKKIRRQILLKNFEGITQLIRRRGISINRRSIEKELILTKLRADFFTKFLRNKRPRIVLLINFYNSVNRALLIACKINNIKCYDVQHGVINDNHYAYIPYKSKHGFINMIPDGFWCWSESDEKLLMKNFPDKDVINGGNTWIQSWQENRNKNFIEEIKKVQKLKPDENTITILAALQSDKINPIIIKALELSPDCFKWLIRVHPTKRYLINKIRQSLGTLANKVEFDLSNSNSLGSLLYITDIIVTEYSSTVLEGLDMGIRSIIIHPEGLIHYRDLLEKKEIHFSLHAKEIIEIIKNCKNTSPKEKFIPSFKYRNGIDSLIKAMN